MVKIVYILYTFNLNEPPRYMTKNISTNVKRNRIEYFEFIIKDELGRPLYFNDDVLSFTLHMS